MLEPDESFIRPLAYKLTSRYQGFVTRNDVAQELRLWWLSHERRVERWQEAEGTNKKRLGRLLELDLWKAGDRYCRRERAQILGYDPADEAFYDREYVRDLVPMAYHPDLVLVGDPNEGRQKVQSGKAPNEGNNLPASVADVSRALEQLNPEDRDLLTMIHGEGLDNKEVAEFLNTSIGAVKMRHQRALKRIVEVLGGESPWTEGPGSRRSVTNATALSITSHQESGD